MLTGIKVPKPQTDELIWSISKKIELFSTNNLLYFERDSILYCNHHQKAIKENVYKVDDTAFSDKHPFYDKMDFLPERTALIGRIISKPQFSKQLLFEKIIKAYFLPMSIPNEGLYTNLWLFFVQSSYFILNKDTNKLETLPVGSVITIKNGSVCFSLELNCPKYLIRSHNGGEDKPIVSHFSCSNQSKTQRPFESFMRSFLVSKEYPVVIRETASFYRYIITHPFFLAILAQTYPVSSTLVTIIEPFIEALGHNILYITPLLLNSHITSSNSYTEAMKKDSFVFHIIANIIRQDPEYNVFSRQYYVTKKLESQISGFRVSALPHYLLHSIYKEITRKFNTEEYGLISIGLFISKWVMNIDCNEEELSKISFCECFSTFKSPPTKISYSVGPLISISSIQAILNELMSKITEYNQAYLQSQQVEEHYNAFVRLHIQETSYKQPEPIKNPN